MHYYYETTYFCHAFHGKCSTDTCSGFKQLSGSSLPFEEVHISNNRSMGCFESLAPRKQCTIVGSSLLVSSIRALSRFNNHIPDQIHQDLIIYRLGLHDLKVTTPLLAIEATHPSRGIVVTAASLLKLQDQSCIQTRTLCHTHNNETKMQGIKRWTAATIGEKGGKGLFVWPSAARSLANAVWKRFPVYRH